jgi:type II secretory pathway pseudopilin PulG
MVLLIVLVLLAVAAFGIFGFLLLGSTARAQKKSEQNALSILDAAFDGSDSVTFKINATTLKYETVITGACERGYKLAHQADNQYGPHTLMFEKAV